MALTHPCLSGDTVMLRLAMAALVVTAFTALLGVIGLPDRVSGILRWMALVAAVLAALFTLIGLFGRRDERAAD